jgi:hypothetical protein
MPRQTGISVTNDFRKGLITQATGLNFPENACTNTYNCEFNLDGSVNRRLGFDFETAFANKTINRTNSAVATYLWKNVGGDGNITIFVVQVGPTIFFYKAVGGSISSGAVSTTVTLTPVSGAPTPDAIEAQFADGNGFLFVTHPYCQPMRISYNTTTDTATPTNIDVKIRDFEGDTADALAVDNRPTSTFAGLTAAHSYNLQNQGWTSTNLTAWDTAQTTMPSNADVMWRFKNATNDFDFGAASLARLTFGNSPASKGHFIMSVVNQNRDTAAGTTGATATSAGSARFSTCAFFAGRMFYAGINASGFNSRVYFTQIVENTPQYEMCYQVNDPTADDFFDLLPNDGGVIKIPDAGTIIKLFSIPGGLAIFAANGIWLVTGNQGIGFTANDYTVLKISNITTLSATSFVNIQGYPMWWNADGIYSMAVQSNGVVPQIEPITYGTIKEFFDGIPLTSKKFAKGFYNYIDGVVQWLYRSTATDVTTNAYEYDRILNYNTYIKSFYPWTITPSAVTVNAIVVCDSISGLTSVDNVIDGSANNVVDGSTNQVITFTNSGVAATSLTSKFLVSSSNGAGSYNFTFAETKNTSYLDWFLFDTTGVDFTSFFTTGYRLRGEGLRKSQPGWVAVASRTDNAVAYTFQGIWDFAVTAGAGRFTTSIPTTLTPQNVNHPSTNANVVIRRLKVRGRGRSLQFSVSSVSGQPFDIIGWSVLDQVNSIP